MTFVAYVKVDTNWPRTAELTQLGMAYSFKYETGGHLYAAGATPDELRTRTELLVRQLRHKRFRVERYRVTWVLVDSFAHDEFQLLREQA